jgi:(S)-3,5-dihydroxyphenylglycine transaminase
MSARSPPSRLKVMNFLNEVAADYPKAISFASGRPAQQFFDVDDWWEAPARFQRHYAEQMGIDTTQAGRLIMQYGRTAGLINTLIAEQLGNDDGVRCQPDQVVVTTGCQEAMALCIRALCASPEDVLLVRDPTYIGATGAADLFGVEVVPLSSAGEDDLCDELREVVTRLAANGRRARALYLIPEFDNPTGRVLTTRCRARLIELCAQTRIAVLEDNPYGMFRFEGESGPTMWTLDHEGVVIYLATYSKTLCPAVRVGCAVVPERLLGDGDGGRELVATLSERKSFLTVNASQTNQAMLGGVLLDSGGSLRRRVGPAIAFYRRNRDVLVDSLERAFGADPRCRWNVPEGGFFLTLQLPFRFLEEDLVACASRYGVIPMPMSYFSFSRANDRIVRLAFSNNDPDAISEGVNRLARFVAERKQEQADEVA